MKYIPRILLTVLLATALSVAGLYAYLHNDHGRIWLAETISNRVPGIALSGLHGSLPDDFHIARLAISDDKGMWLELNDTHIAWHPLALLHGTWQIDALEAAKLHVMRMPESNEKKPSEGFSLPKIPNVVLGKLAVGDIRLDPPVTGRQQRLTLFGGGSDGAFDLTAKTLEGPETVLVAHTGWAQGWHGAFDFTEVPQGWVGALLKLPAGQSLHASIHADEVQGVVQFKDAVITAGTAHVSGTASYALSGGALKGEFQLAAADLSAFSKLAGNPLAGALSGTIHLSGTLDAPAASVDASSESITVAQNIFTDAALNAKLQPHEGALGFAIQANATERGQPVALTLEGEKRAQRITLSSLEASYGDYHMKGSGQTQLDEGQFNTALTLANSENTLTASAEAQGHFDAFRATLKLAAALPQGTSELNASGKFAGGIFNGSLDGQLSGNGQHFTLTSPVAASDAEIRLKELAVKGEGLSLTGNAAWIIAKQQAQATLALAAPDLAPLGKMLDVPLSGSARAQLNLTPGNQEKLSANAAAEGSIGGKAFALNMNATGEQGDLITLALQKLSGSYDGTPFLLASPSRLQFGNASITLSPTTFKLAEGTVRLNAKLDTRTVRAELDASHIALEKLPPATLPTGTLNARLVVAGTPKNPKLTLSANGNAQPENLLMGYTVRGLWQSGNLTLDAKASSDKSLLSLHVALPAVFSLQPFAAGLSASTPLSGKLTLNAPLDSLNPYARQQGLRLGGMLSGNALLSGTLASAGFDGKFLFADAQLDHQDSGICLHGVNATLLASRERIALQNLTAKTPGGSLNAQANLALGGQQDVKGAVEFRHFGLFCGGPAKGDIDGALHVSGTSGAANLTGQITLGPLNVQLPGQTPGRIPIAQVEMVRADKKRPALATTAAPLMLDIGIKAPERIFIRGRGLDAEFGGKLAITGPVNAPEVNGEFKARRGHFTLLDRELKLSNAALRFNGPIPPSPYLDITAETTAQDTAIEAHLTGAATKPEFSFSSSPSLPKDQILALLLFGRSLSALTPFQAIQLAQSIAELSGKASGPGVLGKLRGALGVDRLDVGSDSNNSVTVGAGKYITDKVYVGVTQGAEPQDRAVTTEVEVTPRISATTSVDAEGQQSLGLQWKYDY